MRLQTLVISDIHLPMNNSMNSFSSNIMYLFDFIDSKIKRGVKYEKIVLLGDILEDWYIESSEAFANHSFLIYSFFYKLKYLSDRIIFVKGNHDTDDLFEKLPINTRDFLDFMKVEVCEDSFREDELFFSHGHKGEYKSSILRMLNVAAAKIGFNTLKFIAFLFGTAGKTIFNKVKPIYDQLSNSGGIGDTQEEHEKYYSKVRSRIGVPNGMVLVCGHTHRPIVIQSMLVINDGDWMKNTTFVEINHDDKLATLCKYTREGIETLSQLKY